MTDSLPDAPFAPLPLRRRTTLEILDTAVKLYRRYLGVLLGWSAIVSLIYVVLTFTCSFLSFLAMPMLYGSVSCCIAAAVRGQRVSFKQIWEFTQPRFGAVLGVTLLSGLIFSVAVFVLMLAAVLIGVAGTYAFTNAPEVLQVIGIILGVLLGLIAFSIASLMAFGWLNMVPIVACLEDDKRGMAAMGRAWSLMSGNWRKIFVLATLVGLSIFVVGGIVVGVLMLFGISANVFSGDISDATVWGLVAGMSGVMGLFFLFWNPAQAMVIAVLYLDLRVRKEALDLEWSAYNSAPTLEANPQIAPTLSGDGTLPELGAASAFAQPANASAPVEIPNVAPVSIDLTKPVVDEIAAPQSPPVVATPTFGAPAIVEVSSAPPAFVDNNSGFSPNISAPQSSSAFVDEASGFANVPLPNAPNTFVDEAPATSFAPVSSTNEFSPSAPILASPSFVDEAPATFSVPVSSTNQSNAFVDEAANSSSTFGLPPIVVDETPAQSPGAFGQALQALDEASPSTPPAPTPSSDEHPRF